MVSFIYKNISVSRTGGAVVAGIKFRDALIKRGVQLNLLSYTFGNSNYFGILKDLFFNRNIVIFNLSTKSLFKFIFIFLLYGLSKEKVIVRFFGSDQKTLYNNNILYRLVFKIMFNLNFIVMFETLSNYNFFHSFNKNIYYFPNFIELNKNIVNQNKNYRKRFVFVGNISKNKGLDLILRFLFEHPDYSCDFYGNNNFNFKINKRYKEIWEKSYKGQLPKEDIISIYKKYDFTILPSIKEGYPSVVLESLNQGTPLILSDLPSLIEMVQHSAIFVSTDYEKFKSSILKINNENLLDSIKNIKLDLCKYDQDEIISGFIRDIL